MDLSSGYSDSTNYGNGYTPLANNAINNNNANYNANQAYTNAVGSYDPFAQSGGFGAMTDYYSGLGRDYTTATGGNIFGNSSGGGGGGSGYSYDDSAGLNSSTAQTTAPSSADWDLWRSGGMKGAEPGSSSGYDLGGASGKPAVDQTATSIPSFWQSIRDLTGADPKDQTSLQTYSGGGIGSDTVGAPNQPGANDLYGTGSKAAVDQSATSIPSFWQGVRDTFGADPKDQSQVQQSVFDTGASAYNPYGVDAGTWSGMSAGDRNTFNNTMKAQGEGGIGSDTARDKLAWTMATSSPYAETSTAPSNTTPNLGYNPGMENYFANPTMKQYDWTKNNDQLQQQMQDALKTIDSSTGNNQSSEPYGGKLPDFWQGVRDWTGMGQAQPTPWVNGS